MTAVADDAERVRPATATVAWIGGCHLAGYRVGEAASFVRLAGDALGAHGILVRHAVLQPVPSHHLARMVAFAADQGADVVVLQLGNFETGLTIGSLARRAIGRRGQTAAALPVAPPDPATRYVPTRADAAKGTVKWLLHGAGLGRYVRHELVARQIAGAAAAIADATGAIVLVLPPIACADAVVDGHRRRIEELLACSLPADSYLALDRAAIRASGSLAYADPIHLGSDGHRVVADALVRRLEALLG